MTLYENIQEIETEIRQRALFTKCFHKKSQYLKASLKFREYRENLSIDDARIIV